MNIELKYFSGTGNSFKIIDTCKKTFTQNGSQVSLSSITDKSKLSEDTELLGFCFPVYAFDIPRICRKYLSNMPRIKKPLKAFVLITAGDFQEAGFSVNESTTLLKKKGVDVIYTKVIQMPANWTVAMNPPSKEDALSMIDDGIIEAKRVVQDILNGEIHHHVFNYPPRYSKFGFYKDYYLFRWLGVNNLWREFRVDETCDACGLCEKLCPTDSIQIDNAIPKWSKTCEQCMRCVNYCPKQAIFQKSGGSIKGKNIYFEPSFKPLKMEKHNKATVPNEKTLRLNKLTVKHGGEAMKNLDTIRVHDQGATQYDKQVHEYNSYLHDALFGMSFEYVKPRDRLLDLGIGTGLVSRFFAK